MPRIAVNGIAAATMRTDCTYCALLVLPGLLLLPCSVKEHAIALVRHFEAPVVIMHRR
jgi:hypothetical protein